MGSILRGSTSDPCRRRWRSIPRWTSPSRSSDSTSDRQVEHAGRASSARTFSAASTKLLKSGPSNQATVGLSPQKLHGGVHGSSFASSRSARRCQLVDPSCFAHPADRPRSGPCSSRRGRDRRASGRGSLPSRGRTPSRSSEVSCGCAFGGVEAISIGRLIPHPDRNIQPCRRAGRGRAGASSSEPEGPKERAEHSETRSPARARPQPASMVMGPEGSIQPDRSGGESQGCHSHVGGRRYTPFHTVFPMWKRRSEAQ